MPQEAPAFTPGSSDYFFLDYPRPYAIFAYLGLLAALIVLYGGGGLVAVIVQQEDSRWWTYPYIMLLTLGITRWREPGAQRYHRDAQTASP